MTSRLGRSGSWLLLALLLNSAYLAAFASPTIFYMANVLAHLLLGVALTAGLAWVYRQSRVAFAALGLTVLTGAFLAYAGALRQQRGVLWAHIAFGVVGAVLLTPLLLRGRARSFKAALGLGLALLALLPASTWIQETWFPAPQTRIRNPLIVPTSMQEEGAGPQSPFWPSSARTMDGKLLPADFFLDSKTCGECHRDIYAQWNSSAHHFASFNNQFYRKSIEHMQSIVGTKPSRWCAGCHDHAVLFTGKFDTPITEQLDTAEAQAGLGCVSCHSIVHVDSTMGNGGFVLEYPPLHKLATGDNRLIRALDRFLTYVDPEPHRRTFMKPFMRKDSAEFCSACHKVHLDVPVNSYRWVRGFNEYDTWQASGISGQGARSFYEPDKPAVCVDCHMPLVPSKDPGHRNGVVHSHRFPAANIAVAFANQDAEQIKVTEAFLKSGFISVDIFAAAPVQDQPGRVPMWREVGNVVAPLDHDGARVKPGSTVRVDVVVRTRKIGHSFPGGTADAFDVWLELQGTDAEGRVIFWSGMVESNGRGPVEPGAHFYRVYLLDAEGNQINKRNAFQARSVLYARLIPPGAADVAHYRIKIPRDAKSPITLRAKLNYRKFAYYYTQYAYAGEPVAPDRALVSAHYDSRKFTFRASDIPRNVSGKIKDRIPEIPIVTLARAEARLKLGEPVWQPVVRKDNRERWNDWGIGLLLQGDLKGAQYAFGKVTEADPTYADGWLNVARALIQDGQTDEAKPYLEKALTINGKLGRIHFFKALVEKAEGDYDTALRSLGVVESIYPRDRMVLNQRAHVLFLKGDYGAAIKAAQRVLAIDPEDIQAHYTLMLSYRKRGDLERAAKEEKLFRRFKTDEFAQAITAKPRLASPEDNNESQPIHDHEGIPLARLRGRNPGIQ